MRKTEDGSLIGEDGRLLYCSTERFLRDVCEGDHCFICGRPEREVRFNREHVLPSWMLHRYDLHRKTLTLPNGEEHRYGTYTFPAVTSVDQRGKGALTHIWCNRGHEGPIKRA